MSRAELQAQLTTPGGTLAILRIAGVPIFFVAERFVEHPSPNTEPFGPLLIAAAIYATVALGRQLAGRPLAPLPALAAIDLLCIVALVATSGGPFSQARYAFFLLPIGAGLLLAPGRTALVSGAAVVGYGLIAVTYPGATAVRDDAIAFELTQAFFLIWMGLAATLLSSILTRRTREIERLAASRGRLVAQALDAEGAARRRLAEGLHDHALQNLLAARQFLQSGQPADLPLAVEGLDAGVRQIRDAVFDLHPYVLEQAGLRSALDAIGADAARRTDLRTTIDVDDDAEGVHDRLVFAIARELIANVIKHADASTLLVRATRADDALLLEVADDGRGIDWAQAAQAARTGHIGLASCTERAETIGGSLHAGAGPDGRGTTVTVRLPAPAR